MFIRAARPVIFNFAISRFPFARGGRGGIPRRASAKFSGYVNGLA